MNAIDAAQRTRARWWIGPSGWSYPDWEGVVYPPGLARREHLSFIARYFNAVEVNTSFYRPVTRAVTSAWVRKVSGRAGAFRFAFKLARTFTHERGAAASPAEAAAFEQGLAPIVDAGLFGCLLIQFPWSFRACAETRDHVRRLCDAFDALPKAVEVRHRSWDDAAWREELAARGVAACRIDQPALRDCLGITPATACGLAYIRLHGRRTDTWFARNVPVFERYNYTYSVAELAPWAERIRESADSAGDVYVFTNNHYRGQGPANALQLRAMLEGQSVDVPQPLAEAFPALGAIHRPPPRRTDLLF